MNKILLFFVFVFVSSQTTQADYLSKSPSGVKDFYFVILNYGGFEESWFDALLRDTRTSPRQPFFNSFLFNCTSVERPTETNPKNRHGLWPYRYSKPDTLQAYSEITDWNIYMDLLFTDELGKQDQQLNLSGLNIAAVKASMIANVIITIPYPDPRQQNFGNPDDAFSSWDFSKKDNIDRIQACQWFIDQIILRWGEYFPNLRLAGFYWINETVRSWGTSAAWGRARGITGIEKSLIQSVAAHIHKNNLEFYWIPGSGKKRPHFIQDDPNDLFNRDTGYGFDVVVLQPGIKRYKNKYHEIAQYSFQKGYGVYIECLTQYDGWLRTLTENLDGGNLLDYQNNCVHGYWFWPGISLVDYNRSYLGWQRAIYEKVFRFVNRKYNKLGYYCNVGDCDTSGAIRNYDGDDDADDEDIDLHTPGICLFPNYWQVPQISPNDSSFRESKTDSAFILLNYPYPDMKYEITIHYKADVESDGYIQQYISENDFINLGRIEKSTEWSKMTFTTQTPYNDYITFYKGENFTNVLLNFTLPIKIAEMWAVPIDSSLKMFQLEKIR